MKATMIELWFPIVVSICIMALVKAFVDVFLLLKGKRSTNGKKKISSSLPPEGPFSISRIPFIGGLIWLRKSSIEIESSLRSISSRTRCVGNNNNNNRHPAAAITVRFTSKPSIFVFSRSLAHKALVQKGALFADRPKPTETTRIVSCNQHNINSAGYGDTWRILRRNLTSQILHPSRVQSYSQARSWVLGILIDRLSMEMQEEAVQLIDHFRYAMFCLLVLMCFGDKLKEDEIKEIQSVNHNVLLSFRHIQVLNLRPHWLTKIIFSSRWKLLFDMMKNREDVMIPLIRRRREKVRELTDDDHSSSSSSSSTTTTTTLCYVDSLLDLDVPDADETTNNDDHNVISNNKKRKLTEEEMVTACSEFLNAGTDTTTTALQWIMANLVKYPHIQEKLYQDIKGVLLARCTEEQQAEVDRQVVAVALKEEDLSKMNYLKAVVLEGLRRHPPAHFLIPHAVTQDVELDGYLFSKDSIINFVVDDFGMNPEVWEDPLQFKPERFLPYLSSGNGFDITGSHDIKMMPFGAGRRICPAYNLAIHHLEYFVANLVWRFEWRSSSTDGNDIDLSEKQEFTTVMKYPLRARIIPRGLSTSDRVL